MTSMRSDIIAALRAEKRRATQDGIGRETLPFAEPHQLPGYLAALDKAIAVVKAL